MSATFTLYIVGEKKLPRSLSGASDREKYKELVAAVEAGGAKWSTLELRTGNFIEALEVIDAKMGGTGFLSALSFNNSPHSLLDNADCPAFGYFNPEQTRELHTRFKEMSAGVKEALADADSAVAKVLYAYESTAAEAARRGYAIAVIHT